MSDDIIVAVARAFIALQEDDYMEAEKLLNGLSIEEVLEAQRITHKLHTICGGIVYRKITKKEKKLKQDVFKYLNGLREDGCACMYNTKTDIQETFGIDKVHAGKLLIEWMLDIW